MVSFVDRLGDVAMFVSTLFSFEDSV
jgi:hypothetical protein